MYDFFICYSRNSYFDVTHSLVDELESLGFSIWIDKFDVPLGINIYKNIQSVIKECCSWCGAIVVLDPTFFEKSWCTWELDNLIKKEIPIIPILWQIKKSDFPKKYQKILGMNYGKNLDSLDGLEEIIISILHFYISDSRFLTSLEEQYLPILKEIIERIELADKIFDKLILVGVCIEYLINKLYGDTQALHWLSICKRNTEKIQKYYFNKNKFRTSDLKFLDFFTNTIIQRYINPRECD